MQAGGLYSPGLHMSTSRCPLQVISGHRRSKTLCPLRARADMSLGIAIRRTDLGHIGQISGLDSQSRRYGMSMSALRQRWSFPRRSDFNSQGECLASLLRSGRRRGE
jgi:hypothetical protein